MSVKIQEGFALFSKRMDAKAYIEGEDESLDNMESQRILEIKKERDERKRKLLFDNLDLIMRHRDEIMKTPRYAKIDVHYALRGGGAYIGPIAMRGSGDGGYHAGLASRDLGDRDLQGELWLRQYRLHPLLRRFSAYGNVCRGGHLPALQERNPRNPEQALWRLRSAGDERPRPRKGGGFAGVYLGRFRQAERAV